MADSSYALGHVTAIPGAQVKLGSPCSLLDQLGTLSDSLEFRICRICGQKCRSASELRRHVMTHTGERPYRCPHCPYSSALKTNVKRHMMCLHKSDCPVVCTLNRTNSTGNFSMWKCLWRYPKHCNDCRTFNIWIFDYTVIKYKLVFEITSDNMNDKLELAIK